MKKIITKCKAFSFKDWWARVRESHTLRVYENRAKRRSKINKMPHTEWLKYPVNKN